MIDSKDSKLLVFLKSVDLRDYFHAKIKRGLKDILKEKEYPAEVKIKNLEVCSDYLEITVQGLRANGAFEYYNINEKEFCFTVEKVVKWIDGEINSAKDEVNILPSGSLVFREYLNSYGFFKLPLVCELEVDKQNQLAELIYSQKLPYALAMFGFLGFIKYLDLEYFPTKVKRNIEISKWFGSSKDGRDVRGYIDSLNTHPKEGRYKAHLHKEKVEKDYYQIK